MSVRCAISGLTQPECSCVNCLRELVVNQLEAKRKQPKENT
jgi:hypothetical protein